MSRRLLLVSMPILALPLIVSAHPASAQQIGTSQPVFPAVAPVDRQARRAQREERELTRTDDGYGPAPPVEDCAETDSGIISGEIVVCRQRRDQSEFRLRSADQAETDYARATMNAGNPQSPDVAGPGIFRGKATVSGMCFVPPCPTPTMPDIDFAELPEAPAGSDADRIGRGLPAIGFDGKKPGAEGTEASSSAESLPETPPEPSTDNEPAAASHQPAAEN